MKSVYVGDVVRRVL